MLRGQSTGTYENVCDVGHKCPWLNNDDIYGQSCMSLLQSTYIAYKAIRPYMGAVPDIIIHARDRFYPHVHNLWSYIVWTFLPMDMYGKVNGSVEPCRPE